MTNSLARGRPASRSRARPSPFPGAGEMNARCRAFDWGATPLGPVDGWSHSLRATVGTLLNSRSPMFVFWGPEHVQIYNDAYRPSLGTSGRHPRALGASGPTFWTDIWNIIGPEIEQVMATGVPTWHEDAYIPIERDGGLAEVWWTYGYSPVFDDDGSIQGTLVVCQETTAKVLFERELGAMVRDLQTERAHLSALFERSPAGLAVLTGDDLVYEQTNPAYAQTIGGRDVVGCALLDAFPELAGQDIDTRLHEVRATGVPFIGNHVPVAFARARGGVPETRYFDLVFQRFTETDGAHSVFVHSVEVTDEVLAVASLRDTEAQLRDQFAKMPVATSLWEQAGDDFVLVAANEAAELVAPGIGARVGRRRRDLFPGTEDVADDYRRCLREDVIIHRTAERTGPAGAERDLEISVGPQQPNRVLVHITDVTDKIALETRLRRSERMESVGLLAGGIAHDFNNLITVIQAHSKFLLEDLGEAASARADVEAIREATDRAAELTRQLLAFSRKQILKPSHVDANSVLAALSGMLRHVLGPGIKVETSFTDLEATILIDPTQLEQIIMNLAYNARDAMPAGGVFTINTKRSSEATGPMNADVSLVTEDHFVIEVGDTGTGMEEAVRSRAFEPFFSTKDESKGQGMGLATVYGIVHQSRGHIDLESAPGKGTTARLFFPRSAAAAAAPPATQATARSTQESILLIEDDSGVRAVARRMLTRAGYSVIEAANGVEALAIADDPAISLHMVLSDIMMPGMGGAEVIEKVSARRSGIRVAVMSGHTDDEDMRRGIYDATVPFLQKPFTPAQLTCFVRDVLDAEAVS